MTDMSRKPEPKPKSKSLSRALRTGSLVIVAATIGAAILYGIIRPGGKESAAIDCVDALPVVERMAPHAQGQVAAMAISKAPQLATPVSFLGPDGTPKTLADFKGKTILLNLWATWCVPCREEMPSLDRLQARLGGPDFEVVTVNIDTSRLERRQSFLKEVGVSTLAFYADPSADVFQTLKKAGKVTGLPTTYLINSKTCLLGTMPGGADWASEDAVRLIEAALRR